MASIRSRDLRRRPMIAALLAVLLALGGVAFVATPAATAQPACTWLSMSIEMPSVQVGTDYASAGGHVWVNAVHGTPPYTIRVADGYSLPQGLTLLPTGEFSGAPTQTGDFQVRFSATDSTGCSGTSDVFQFSVTTNDCSGMSMSWTAPPDDGHVGLPYSVKFVASGATAPYTWKVDGTLPPGLKLSSTATTATISGIPTKAGNYGLLRVTATDAVTPGPCHVSFPMYINVVPLSGSNPNPGSGALTDLLVAILHPGCLEQLVQVLLGQLPKMTCLQ